MRLSDSIEHFIKTMLTQEEREVELKRNELAAYFNCAPSQINYVLSTRFTPDDGYVIESRRGGGGYIRIVRVVETDSQHLLYLLNQRIGDRISELEAMKLIGQLRQTGIINPSELGLMQAAVSAQSLSVPMTDDMKAVLRAKILRSMLTALAKENRTNNT